MNQANTANLYTTFTCFGPIARTCLKTILANSSDQNYDKTVEAYVSRIDTGYIGFLERGTIQTWRACFTTTLRTASGLWSRARMAARAKSELLLDGWPTGSAGCKTRRRSKFVSCFSDLSRADLYSVAQPVEFSSPTHMTGSSREGNLKQTRFPSQTETIRPSNLKYRSLRRVTISRIPGS